MVIAILFFSLIGNVSLFSADHLMEDLQSAREKGDFQRVFSIEEELEGQLEMEEDPFIRTSMRRALWVESIPLMGSGIFDYTISAMEFDGDDIWIGTRSGDIARYSLSERKWFLLQIGAPSLAIRSVNAIQAEKDQIWFLSYGSVLLYDKRSGKSYQLDLPDNPNYRGMQSFSILGRGILVGTQASGLRRILPREETVIPIPELRNVSFLQKTDGNTLFAGSETDGLYVLDSTYSPQESINNNRSTASVRVLLKQEGGFLGGSYGSGLFYLKEGEGDFFYFQKLLSPGNWITDGTEISKGYCFSTLGNGLIFLSREDMTPLSIGIAEGLPSLDIAALEYSAPYLICGTQGQGLLIVHENFFK